MIMPVSQEIAMSNRTETERMRRLVKRLTGPMFAVRLRNGWTVAGALAHVAFWDRQRLCVLQRWSSGKYGPGEYDGEVFNAALQPLLELIPPERVAEAAVQTAEEIDALLLQLSDEVIADVLARPNPPRLDRGSHRGYHLNQIDEALSVAGFG
jgi:hypothetical protein